LSNFHSLALASLLLVACLGENIEVDPNGNPPGENTPPSASNCGSSALCLFENAADTSLLTAAQRDSARRLQSTPAHNRVSVVKLSLADLRKDSLTLELFPGIVLTVASQGFEIPAILTDSIYYSWTGTNTVTGGLVELGFLNGKLMAGSIYFDGKVYTLAPLDEGTIMVFELEQGWRACGDYERATTTYYLGCQTS
jgi:hypothetical protein